MPDTLKYILMILVVVGIFNLIIFVHELGHFLAARWRGLQVDRFQVWFGKPIWKKEINGVQYGLGWLPFGGFVALPQMVTMESVEGTNRGEDELPPVTPLDKIIVAFSGPFFSLSLAFLGALLVWQVGTPKDAIKSTVIGGVVKDSPAETIGLQPGDNILKVNGESVEWYAGNFEAIKERIMLTEGDGVSFEVERDGKVLQFESKYDIKDTPFWKRRALPSVGLAPGGPAIVGDFMKAENDGPAQRAGLLKNDEIIAVNGTKVFGTMQVGRILADNDWKESVLQIKRGDQIIDKTITPLKPNGEFYKSPMIGIQWDMSRIYSSEIIYPDPFTQIGDSLKTMWTTIKIVSSPKSKVGVDQLAGPVGIAKTKFQLLMLDDGWRRVMWFFVLFNVNLAVLNMLPLPVLDGGHIVMAIMEWVRGRPINPRVLEVVQSAFALVLVGFMLFITTKDIGDSIPGGKGGKPPEQVVWPDAA